MQVGGKAGLSRVCSSEGCKVVCHCCTERWPPTSATPRPSFKEFLALDSVHLESGFSWDICLSLCVGAFVFLCLHLPSSPSHVVYLWVFIPLCFSVSPLPSCLYQGLSSGPACGANFLIPASTSNQNFQFLPHKEPHFAAKLGWGFQEPRAASISRFTYLTSQRVALGPFLALA